MAAKAETKLRVVADNRKARFNYFIDETLEAGVALTGTEVKSLRNGKATIGESYADARDGEIWLINSNIPEYQQHLLLFAVLLAGTVTVLAWVVVLRRLVAQQTILLRESEERFRHMALHDALTGLATRLLLQDRLDVALASARRHRTRLAVLMVDLDNFKEINDAYGHQAGDDVLRVTARRLQDAVRKEDTVSRLGGDEFVVLLPDLTDAQAAERTAARIVETLAVPIPLAKQQVPVSVSVGVCAASGEEIDAEDLMRFADTALYRAKANGRNCYAVETAELDRVQPA